MSHYVDEGFKTYVAGGSDIPAYTAVKRGTGNTVVAAAAATDVIIGVIHAAVKAGYQIDVRLRSAGGTLNLMLAGTVALGDAVTANAAGLGVTTTTAGNHIIGYALEAGTTGKIIELLPSVAKF